jgi:hypothetical protein
MGRPIDRRQSRLPQQFPVGATYVVEGHGGAEGNFRVIARYVVLPSGRRINVAGEVHRPAPRTLDLYRRANSKRSRPKGRLARDRKKSLRGGERFAAAGVE